MSNRNENVIIAYFPSAEKASEAAEALKSWDKANDDIKLGGIGIIVAENGELKTHSVGAKATGTGAKAGTVIGVVAGILSGGLALIGGALAGLAGGALLGSLKHKSLGLTDGDYETFKQELIGGKAALVVTADDHEVYDTLNQIRSLGGEVVSYTADRDAMQALTMAAIEQERQLRGTGLSGDPTRGIQIPPV
ncbi:MAG: DUF1269 domain-containing protein [Candidatus Brachytrichaceae bacterium NZ_4S206]|jgi:uncharacterized membrane protein